MGAGSSRTGEGTLAGVTVVDLSRMLPGAVASRQLVDLGARVIKVEEPGTGDPLRVVPPLAGGVGVAFATLLRGVESVELDLATDRGAAAVRRLARGADVLLESFRPGTLERWGLGRGDLGRLNPGLVVCSLPSWPSGGSCRDEVGHDLNFIARAGLLANLEEPRVPPYQLADVTAGLLAATSILAALLARARTGRGAVLEQPLGTAALAWTALPRAAATAGGEDLMARLLGGHAPCYGLYRCGDGRSLAVGALEPKFWLGFVRMLGLPHLADAGLDTGEAGAAARREVLEALGANPAAHWAELARAEGLPVTVVATVEESVGDPCLQDELPPEEVELPDGSSLPLPGSWLAAAGRRALRAPSLGEHTKAVLREIGLANGETRPG